MARMISQSASDTVIGGRSLISTSVASIAGADIALLAENPESRRPPRAQSPHRMYGWFS